MPALASGMHLTMVTGIFNAMFLIMELPNTRVYSWCVTELEKSIRNIDKVVMNHRIDFRAMPPLSDCHPASLRSQLHYSLQGQLTGLPTLGSSPLANGAWLPIRLFSTLQSRVSNSKEAEK